ncbi:hypothetical protein [Aerococcus urinaeequi]|uniref:hypothetical protein n=1 Tax=Aerococcus TaxID=1375 RepID=UPI003AAB05A2
MTYYQEKLDGKILASVEYGSTVDPENPGQLPLAFHHYLMHGTLETCGQRLLCSDEFPSENQPDFNDVSVAIMSDDLDQLQTYFANLEKDAIKVILPFQATDWSPG